MKNKKTLNRRQLLNWSVPTIASVTLPAHAQTSIISCGSTPIMVVSSPAKCSGVNPIGEATLTLLSNAAGTPSTIDILSINVTTTDPNNIINIPNLPATVTDTVGIDINWTGNATDTITCLPIETVTLEVNYNCGANSMLSMESFDLTNLLASAL